MHSLDYVEFADLVLPGGISAGAKSMLEEVLAAHVTCARQDRRSRSPHRFRYVARETTEFGIPQQLKNAEIPVSGPRAACLPPGGLLALAPPAPGGQHINSLRTQI